MNQRGAKSVIPISVRSSGRGPALRSEMFLETTYRRITRYLVRLGAPPIFSLCCAMSQPHVASFPVKSGTNEEELLPHSNSALEGALYEMFSRECEKLSISSCCHMLLYYGLKATNLPNYPSGKQLLQLLTNEEAAIKVFGKSPFIHTRHGLRYALAKNDQQSYPRHAESHRDQCLAILSLIGIQKDMPIATQSKNMAVADLVNESVANFALSQHELSWSAIAYAAYLPPKTEWKNRFGERTTFSQLVMTARRSCSTGRSAWKVSTGRWSSS